jgi:hypothetical protein
MQFAIWCPAILYTAHLQVADEGLLLLRVKAGLPQLLVVCGSQAQLPHLQQNNRHSRLLLLLLLCWVCAIDCSTGLTGVAAADAAAAAALFGARY